MDNQTVKEAIEASKYANGEWALLSFDHYTQVSTCVRRENISGTSKFRLYIREEQPRAHTEAVLAENKAKRDAWTSWHGKEGGASVASIPIPVHNALIKQCGFDGATYDRYKYNRLLNDPDYKNLRTGGGKLKARPYKIY